MVINIILIVLIVLGMAFAGFKVSQKIKYEAESTENTQEEIEDIHTLINYVEDYFNALLRENIKDQNLDQKTYLEKQKIMSALETNISQARVGNRKAKRALKAYIKDLLTAQIDYPDDYIPFDDLDLMTPSLKFHTMLHLYNRIYDGHGFNPFMTENGFDKEIEYKGEKCFKTTKSMVNAVYEDFIKDGITKKINGKEEEDADGNIIHYKLTDNDKMDILTQCVYAARWGLGEIDDLYDSDVDEIDGGTSGIPYGSFAVKSESNNIPFSYESIWITFHGLNIQLECLSFGSQEEFIRICENVYKYDPPYVLSRTDAKIVASMSDGSRITVARPTFSDSYVFWLRKFDTVASIQPKKLVNQDNAVMIRKMIYWSMQGRRTIAITGAQNTGKTTFLKSVSKYIPTTYNVRTSELQFESNYRFAYPYRNIASFQSTASISEQDALDFQKKTNGGINIIGEVANAHQAAFVIQTSGIASYFTLFTSHHETSKKLVEGFGDNLLSEGLAQGKKEAYSSCSQSLNIDCHLVFEPKKQFRHAERITEIIPLDTAKQFPSELKENETLSIEDKNTLDSMEYFKRTTDPAVFETVNLVEWDDSMQRFIWKNDPSERFLSALRGLVPDEKYEEFLHDVKIFKKMSDPKLTRAELKALEKEIEEI